MNPFKLISTREVYKNPWISVREDSVIRPGGADGVFGVVSAKDGSTVLAIDEDNNVYITNEFHYAIAEQRIELISGGRDEGESYLECAQRELLEEAGIEAEEWIELGYIDPFSGIINCKNFIFLARRLSFTDVDPDEGEIVNLGKIPYTQALQMVMNSEITHGASVAAILKAQKYI